MAKPTTPPEKLYKYRSMDSDSRARAQNAQQGQSSESSSISAFICLKP